MCWLGRLGQAGPRSRVAGVAETAEGAERGPMPKSGPPAGGRHHALLGAIHSAATSAGLRAEARGALHRDA
jgi:hypothetical protein